MGADRDAAAEERAEDRATASGIRPEPPDPRPVTTAATRKAARRRRPEPYNPPQTRPTQAHIEAGRAGLAASRAALAAANAPTLDPPEEHL